MSAVVISCDAGVDSVVLPAGGRGGGGVCGGLAAGGGLLLPGVRRGGGLVRGTAGQPRLFTSLPCKVELSTNKVVLGEDPSLLGPSP